MQCTVSLNNCSRKLRQLCLAILATSTLTAGLAIPAAAQTQAPPDATQDSSTAAFFKHLDVSGFVDGYYGYNFNKPADGKAGPERIFDVRHNAFSFNLAEFSVEKKPVADSRAGFRLDFDFGPTADLVKAAEPGGAQILRNIGQAYVSYLAPVGKGWQFDFGEFVTPLGNEVIKTKDNWNYSRGLLFTLAIPFYHMGVRSTYSFNDSVTFSGYVVNGWNNIVDNNTKKTLGVQAAVKPFKSLTLTQGYMGGVEQTGVDDRRHVLDSIATYTVTPKLILAGNYDFGMDKQSGARVEWQGFAGYARFQPTAWVAISPRAEYYNDRDGFTSGQAQKIKEATVTGELKQKDGFVLRLEYRHDFSDIPFWVTNNRFIDHQSTFTVGVLYSISNE